MQLFLYNVSGGLMKPTDTDTGLGIVTKSNVTPYLAVEPLRGHDSRQKTLKPPAMIRATSSATVHVSRFTACSCSGGDAAGAGARRRASTRDAASRASSSINAS